MNRIIVELEGYDGVPYQVECDVSGENVTVDRVRHPVFPDSLFPSEERNRFAVLIQRLRAGLLLRKIDRARYS